MVVDGRGTNYKGYEDGFFLGPTYLTGITYRQLPRRDIWPSPAVLRTEDFETAMERHPNINTAMVAVFTRNGGAAREFAQRVNVGMVGINVQSRYRLITHSVVGNARPLAT